MNHVKILGIRRWHEASPIQDVSTIIFALLCIAFICNYTYPRVHLIDILCMAGRDFVYRGSLNYQSVWVGVCVRTAIARYKTDVVDESLYCTIR